MTDAQQDKSPQAFKTISEVAEELNVPQHVLRFWENKFAQIKPMKRRGGRRYYRPEDVEKIRAIKRLLYEEGFTIKGAVRYFAKHPQSWQSIADNDNPVSVTDENTAAPQPQTIPEARPVMLDELLKSTQQPPQAAKATPIANNDDLKRLLGELQAMRSLVKKAA